MMKRQAMAYGLFTSAPSNRVAWNRIRVKKSAPGALFVTFWMLIHPLFGSIALFYALYSSKRYSRWFAAPIGLLYGVIGYNLYVKNEPDIVRYIQIIRSMRGLSFSAVFREDTELLYTKDALFYLISKTKDEYILPFVIGWITYTVVFFVYFDFMERTRYDMTWARNGKLYAIMAVLTAVSVQSSFSVIGNVRCVSSYVLMTYAIYRELVQKKTDVVTYFCYIVPCFMHTSAVFLLGLRLVLIVFARASNIKYLLSLLVICLFPAFGHFGSQLLQSLPLNILQFAGSKSMYYMEWTSGGFADEATQYTTYWIERIYGTPFLLYGIFYYFQLTKRNPIERFRMSETTEEGLSLFRQYLFLLAVMALCCLWIKVGAFWRFEACFCLYSPIIFLSCVQRQLEKRGWVSLVLKCLLFSGVLMFLLQSALFVRWVHMDLFFKGILTTCPAFLLYKLASALTLI